MTARIRLVVLLAAAILAVSTQEALALIMGGVGNTPVADPGWPAGAAAIFNTPARIAWWEGPPFGGGQYHAECRGDAKALNAVLADFAKLEVKSKQVVVHDGVGRSFWLNMNNEPAKQAAAAMDWRFMVWQPANWQRLRKLPADLNPTGGEDGPPAQIDVYTGGNIRWADVIMPKDLKVVDERLEAHGFTAADGFVLEGKVTDLATGKPVEAEMQLQRVEPQKTGGYSYTVVALAKTDMDGRWVLKKAPAGWHRVVIESGSYVPRVVGYAKMDDQPRWQRYDCGLAQSATVTGRVLDDAGKPLGDVEVRFQNVATSPGGRYESLHGYTFKTDANGDFRADRLPSGNATIWLRKPGYVRPGLGQDITTPKDNVKLTMLKAARALVTVDFGGKERPNGYIVRIEPVGGEAVGKYGGSGNIDIINQMVFENVPPGKYVFRGRPNPGSDKQESEPVTVELIGGETADIKVVAK